MLCSGALLALRGGAGVCLGGIFFFHSGFLPVFAKSCACAPLPHDDEMLM